MQHENCAGCSDCEHPGSNAALSKSRYNARVIGYQGLAREMHPCFQYA
jgi:hypothetical protein